MKYSYLNGIAACLLFNLSSAIHLSSLHLVYIHLTHHNISSAVQGIVGKNNQKSTLGFILKYLSDSVGLPGIFGILHLTCYVLGYSNFFQAYCIVKSFDWENWSFHLLVSLWVKSLYLTWMRPLQWSILKDISLFLPAISFKWFIKTSH